MYTLLNLPPSEKECFELTLKQLYPEGVQCPWRSHVAITVTAKYLWCKLCRRKWSLKKQLGFGYSKLGWRQILALVICWCGKQSPGDIMTGTGLSYPTTLRWLERLRSRLPVESAPLEGLLETDQSYLGRQKYHNQHIVMGVVDRDTSQVRLAEIPDCEQDSVEGFLDRYATVGSLLHADGHSSHLGLQAVGYGLVICNHSLGHFGPTNRIESVWSCLDRFTRRTRDRFMHQFLPGLLQEFQARKNQPELFECPFTLLRSMAVPV
jgi:transposase-like protein